MKKNGNFFSTFIIFLLISTLIFFIFKSGRLGGISDLTNGFFSPFEKMFLSFSRIDIKDEKIKKIQEENTLLKKQLLDIENLKKENNALRDQFKTTYPNSLKLISAKIVGSPGFIPGINVPEILIIDKGKKDGLKEGLNVVYKDNLVGKIEKVTNKFSKVIVLTKKDFSFTAKTAKTGAQGVIKGKGENEMMLDNVLLSEELKTEDMVLTKGDVDLNGSGLVPNLIIGKVVSVDKKASSLFQSAKVQSLLDLSKISEVFIVVDYK